MRAAPTLFSLADGKQKKKERDLRFTDVVCVSSVAKHDHLYTRDEEEKESQHFLQLVVDMLRLPVYDITYPNRLTLAYVTFGIYFSLFFLICLFSSFE